MALLLLLAEGSFHRSGAAENRDAAAQGYIPDESDGDFFTLYKHGNLYLAAGTGKHFFQLFRVSVHIDIDGPVSIGCPSLITKGSGIRSVYDDFVRHNSFSPVSRKLRCFKSHRQLTLYISFPSLLKLSIPLGS